MQQRGYAAVSPSLCYLAEKTGRDSTTNRKEAWLLQEAAKATATGKKRVRYSLTISQAVSPALTARPAVLKASDVPLVAVKRESNHRAMEVNRVNTVDVGSSRVCVERSGVEGRRAGRG